MNLFELFGKISLDGTGFNSAIDKAVGAAKGLVTAIGAATGAVVAFAGDSVRVGMEFDKSMSQVAATMGKTVDEIQDLRDFAQDMGATTAFSATQAADALNYMALAGYDSATSMEMLPNVLNLAAAGGIDLAYASDMVTDSQSALGLSLEETSVLIDQMAKASSKTNTSVEQLGEAILTVGGTAQSLSGGTYELSAILGVMADNGIKGAEAGTHLRNIMLAMNPTTEAAADAFEKLGVDAYDSNGNLRNLEQVFLEMGTAMDGMSDKEKQDIITSIFNKTDIASVNALLGTNAKRWRELNREIDNASGAAETMAETQLDNLAGDITMFQSALEGAQILISDGLSPDLREFVQFGTDSIGTLSEAFKEGGLSGAMDAIGSILSDGVTLIVQKLPEFVRAGSELLASLANGLIQNFPIMLSAAKQIIAVVVDTMAANGPQLLSSAREMLQTLAVGITNSLPTLITSATEMILTLADKLTDSESLGNIIDSAVVLLVTLATGLADNLPKLVPAVISIITTIWEKLTDPDNLSKLLGAALEIIIALADGLIAALPKLWSSVKTIGTNIVTGIWDGIAEKWEWLKGKFSGYLDGLVGGVKDLLGIHSPSRVFAGIGQNMAAGLGEGWNDEISEIRKGIEDDLAFDADAMGYDSDGFPGSGKGGVTVIQNIYSKAQTAADLMQEARWEQEMAVMMA